jgi:hypothetical protein
MLNKSNSPSRQALYVSWGKNPEGVTQVGLDAKWQNMLLDLNLIIGVWTIIC